MIKVSCYENTKDELDVSITSHLISDILDVEGVGDSGLLRIGISSAI